MRYFSMFTGIGGFELGIGDRGECVGFCDNDKYASQLLQIKWPTIKNYDDATTIRTSELPDFDLLVGGFPCQSFSIAGKRKGFNDTRGTLFFDVARICADKRPKHLLLENVKGLLSHDGGNTFTTILRVLTDLGYWVEWQVLNSKNFGVPQNRERVFIIGHLGGQPTRTVFPLGSDSKQNNGVQGLITNTITSRTGQAQATGSYIIEGQQLSQIEQINNPKHSNDRVYSDNGISPTLNTMQGGMRQPFVALTEKRTEEAKRIRRETKGKDYSPRRGKKLMARTDGKIGAITSSRNFENLLTNISKVRRLTPLECERLQGFPDGWTDNFSDTQRYKMLGNAVTVNVVKHIINNLPLDNHNTII